MRNFVMMVGLVCGLISGCCAQRPDCDARFPGRTGGSWEPICDWLEMEYSCDRFYDYNRDGNHNILDMEAFCRDNGIALEYDFDGENCVSCGG